MRRVAAARLVGHDPWKPDEAYTFGVVYELLQGGSWIVPTLAGEPFLDKPPLFYLTAAACALHLLAASCRCTTRRGSRPGCGWR